MLLFLQQVSNIANSFLNKHIFSRMYAVRIIAVLVLDLDPEKPGESSCK